jgi:hypothetical protein
MQGAPPPADRRPFDLEDAWIDVGAESAAEAEAMGIRLLDPVALLRRPSLLAGGRIAGPSARLKGACVATIDAARALAAAPGPGTTVFAWTAGDLLNGLGLVHLVRTRGPFDQVLRMSPGFGFAAANAANANGPKPVPLPVDGSGLLTAGAPLTGVRAPLQQAPHAATNVAVPWGAARVTELGLPARYPETPVETVSAAEVAMLTDLLLAAAGRPQAQAPPAPPLPPPPVIVETTQGHQGSAPLLAALISR